MLKVVYKSTPMQTCTQNLFPIPVVEVTVERKTFEEETFRVFCSFRSIHESFLPQILWPHLHNNWPGAICESFLLENLVFYQNAKVFSVIRYYFSTQYCLYRLYVIFNYIVLLFFALYNIV